MASYANIPPPPPSPDSGIGSTVSTVTPSGSASQVKAGKGKAMKGKSPRGPGPSGKGHPPGSVPLPPAGQNSGGTPSAVQSAVIPISGFCDLDLAPFRDDVRPTFTVDAAGYLDLVDSVYADMYARISNSKHIPRALFRYHCVMLWWFRVLWLKKSNQYVLTSDEKSFLGVMQAGEDFVAPDRVAQYLANLGNFQVGSEEFVFHLHEVDFSKEFTVGPVSTGWPASADGSLRFNPETFWLYGQLPVPGITALNVCNEAASVSNAPRTELDLLSPATAEKFTWSPTANVNGWDLVSYPAHHNSVRGTFSSLGWSSTSVAPDVQTGFLVSVSTLKWVSERLSGLAPMCKVYSTKQLALSVMGSPMQAYFLQTLDSDRELSPPAPLATAVTKRFTLDSNFSVSSRYRQSDVLLTPSFTFSYRLERVVPSSGVSRASPWLYVENGMPVAPPIGYDVRANRTFEFGSLAILNVRRFRTATLCRRDGLVVSFTRSPT